MIFLYFAHCQLCWLDHQTNFLYRHPKTEALMCIQKPHQTKEQLTAFWTSEYYFLVTRTYSYVNNFLICCLKRNMLKNIFFVLYYYIGIYIFLGNTRYLCKLLSFLYPDGGYLQITKSLSLCQFPHFLLRIEVILKRQDFHVIYISINTHPI